MRGSAIWQNTPIEPDDPSLFNQAIVDGHICIPDDSIPFLTDVAVGFIAEMIQTYIDAGSERDVIIEDEDLRATIKRVFNDWSFSTIVEESQRYPR